MIPLADYKPAKLKPLTNPLEVREATVRDYVRNAKRAGIDISIGALEALAVHDCEMADAYLRGVDKSPPKPKQAKKPKRIIEPKDDLAAKFKPAPAKRDKPMTQADFIAISHRWPYAMGRLKRILEGAQPHRDPLMVAMSCADPALAVEVLRLGRNWLMRHRDSRHNPFRGMSEMDAMRARVRFVEDICDRSTARFGAWWVK